jgi:hypothetical protein
MIRQLLKPHSKRWFDALANRNVWQAAVTHQIIQWTRSKRVCSLCGKKPARDYRLSKQSFQEGTPATMRLCRDCFQAAQLARGDELQPLPA